MNPDFPLNTASAPLTPELLDATLADWHSLAFLAFDGFTRGGRGLVCLLRDTEAEPPVRGLYYSLPASVLGVDPKITHLVSIYDPTDEIVISFEQPTGLRTQRLRTAPDGDSPQRVWFFEILRRLSEEPESVPEQLPDWFHDAVQQLQTTQATNDRNGS
jgi:hypothetical protein